MNENRANLLNQSTQAKYIQSRYEESFQFLQERKRRQVSQLVLLNNLQRGDQNIASTLLLTLFNRILSNLYDDKIQIKFIPSEEVDQKRINSLNLLAQSDYKEMEKSKLDYDWVWDTLFFGRGYCETLKFNKKRKVMEPCIINPLMFGYDPYFENVQEWRYYWKWITKSKWQLNKLIKDGMITGVKSVREIPSGIDPYLWDYKIRRDQAKLATGMPNDTLNEDVFQILEFYGYDDDGDKAVFWIDRNFANILYYEKLDLKDGKNGESKWPIVVKEAFREPHSSVVFSIADLLEDKHRAKSVLLNLAFIAAKDKANPLYGYNPDKVKDVSQFFQRQISQHIPMDDESAAWPLNTQEPMSAGLIQFISLLTQEANDPVGTGMSLQPVKKGKQTATESAIQQQLNDLAQSLQSKVMQFGEQEFWIDWYNRYKRYSKSGDEKMAAIVGVKGTTFEKVDLGNFKTSFAPGVLVYSAKEAEYKELVLRRDLMQLYPQLAENLDPDGMRNFNKHVFFPKFLQDPSLIDIMLPKSLDEIKAEDENEQLKVGKMPDVAETDNHTTHIYTHYMVTPKTWQTWVHIAWHQELLATQKKQEMDAKAQGGGGDMKDAIPKGGVDTGGKEDKKAKPVKVGEKKKSPIEAASSLKENIQPKAVSK